MKKPLHIEFPLFRWVQLLLEGGGGFTLLVSLLIVVGGEHYDAFAKTIAAILATYIAVSALLYNRGRALPKGPSKTRTLYAAERSFQAALFTIVGIGLSAVLFVLDHWFGLALPANKLPPTMLLFVFLVPLAYLMFGYMSFLFSLRIVSKDFLRPLPPKEIARRIRNAP